MFRRTIPCSVVVLLLMGALAVPPCSTAFGQSVPWQAGIDSAQADAYYMAQQAPTPAPKPPAAKPPVAKPPVVLPEPEPTFEPSSMLESSDPMVRLASVPNMFGDSFGMGGRVFPWELSYHDLFGPSYPSLLSSSSDLPSAGAARRVKIAENNKALPVDRVYFDYNHFQNAVEGSSPLGQPRAASIDEYTIGWEKTFRDGLWSCELRMPFSGSYRYEAPDLSVGTGHFGDLSILLKRVLFSTDTGVVAAGLAISTPTGSRVAGHVGGTPYIIRNDAVNLAPYVGFLSDRFDPLFVQSFFQVDVPLNGDRVQLGNTALGKYNEQTLMYLDLEMGCWLYRNRTGLLSAMAAILEFHYTTTLQNTDLVAGTDGASSLTVANLFNRVDVVNMTIGLHAQVGDSTTLGIGGVVPLDSYPDRFFDGEIQVFLNRMY